MKGLGTHVSTYSLIAGVQKVMTDRQNTACLGKKVFYNDHMSFHGESKVLYEYNFKRKF